MLCSHCYKKIPEGEEVSKTGSASIRVNGQPLSRGGILCKDCAKKWDENQQFHLFLSIVFALFVFAIIIATWWWKRKNH